MSVLEIAQYRAQREGGEVEDYLPPLPTLQDLAVALGGEVDGCYVLAPSPGCDADDRSLVVGIGAGARPWVYDCTGSLWAVRRHVDRASGFVDSTPKRDRSADALKIWSSSTPGRGTLVERYFRERAINLAVPDCLRFHQALAHPSGQKVPAMVAAVTGPDGNIQAIHRTFLSNDGQGKAEVQPPKMSLGPCKGSSIQLAEAGGQLLLAEGIETALSVMQSTGFPAWATISAVGMRDIRIPANVRSVTLCADGDRPGLNAAQAAARRLICEGRDVRIIRSPDGTDFNDLLMAGVGA